MGSLTTNTDRSNTHPIPRIRESRECKAVAEAKSVMEATTREAAAVKAAVMKAAKAATVKAAAAKAAAVAAKPPP